MELLRSIDVECQLQNMNRQDWIKMVCVEKLRAIQSLTSDSQGKESQVFSPVLPLLRQTILFREGLWRVMSELWLNYWELMKS